MILHFLINDGLTSKSKRGLVLFEKQHKIPFFLQRKDSENEKRSMLFEKHGHSKIPYSLQRVQKIEKSTVDLRALE